MSSAGIQNQYRGYSYNLAGGAPLNVSHGVDSLFHLTIFALVQYDSIMYLSQQGMLTRYQYTLTDNPFPQKHP